MDPSTTPRGKRTCEWTCSGRCGHGGGTVVPTFLPDGRLFARNNTQARIVGLEDAPVVAPFARVVGSPGQPVDAMFGPGARQVVTVEGASTHVWDARNGVEMDPIADPSGSADTLVVPSPDLRKFAIREPDGTIRLADGRDDTLRGFFPADGNERRLVRWSPRGTMLAWASGSSIELWRVDQPDDPRRVKTLRASAWEEPRLRPAFVAIAFSADERVIAVIDRRTATVAAFHTVGGRLRYVRDASPDAALAFSPDGRTLAVSGSQEGSQLQPSVTFFDARTGELTDTMDLTSGTMNLRSAPSGIAYAGRGDRLVTINVEQRPGESPGVFSLSIWSIRSEREVGVAMPIPAAPTNVETNADGRRVVVGTEAGYAVVFDLDPQRWQALACRLANSTLSITEWNEYLPGRAYDPLCREPR
jgi:dipeptidyl aminopeptidase/acylaminoacyl peptidase